MTFVDEQNVSSYFDKHLRASTWIAESCLGLSKSSIHRILRNRIHLFHYKLHCVQELEEFDHEARTEFAT